MILTLQSYWRNKMVFEVAYSNQAFEFWFFYCILIYTKGRCIVQVRKNVERFARLPIPRNPV